MSWNQVKIIRLKPVDYEPIMILEKKFGPVMARISRNETEVWDCSFYTENSKIFSFYDAKLSATDLEAAKEEAEQLLLSFIHDVVQAIGGTDDR